VLMLVPKSSVCLASAVTPEGAMSCKVDVGGSLLRTGLLECWLKSTAWCRWREVLEACCLTSPVEARSFVVSDLNKKQTIYTCI
jgi:hypothetical protein